MTAVTFEGVSKRYRMGSRRSLRDAVQGVLDRFVGDGASDSGRDFIWALKDVSFTVSSGETLGIIGANGAGKTTVLKLLSKITEPTTGVARVNGRTSALIELGAGFHPDLTGRENIYLNASILGLQRREVNERFDEIVEFAELAPFIETPVKRYSSGMYARLGFSVAAHVDPDVLLVDEVLSVGDIMFQQKCLNRIQDFQAKGKSIVFVSHNLVSVQKTCSRVIWLDRGRIASEGDPQAVVNDYVYRQTKRSRSDTGSETSDIPLRYGTGEAVIEDVRVLDAAGEERDFFEPMEDIVFLIDYHAPARVEPVNFLLIVTDGEGRKLSGTDFRKEGFEGLTSIEGRGSVQCSFSGLALRPGTYSMIAVIEDGDKTLDRQGKLGPFVIRPREDEAYVDPWRYGVVDTEAHWSAGW